MAKMIDTRPSFKGEGKVWDKFSEYLPNDMVIYNQREINGREYDFEPNWKCIFDEYGQAHEEYGTHVEVPALSIRIFARIA